MVNFSEVYRLNRLEVKVDLSPMGGYRGKVGTLTINHMQHKQLTEWSHQDLQDLARLTQTILHIQEQAGVHNTLIFARQDQRQFKLSLVPYPKCNWIEKIQGFIHVIFGSPTLKEKQAQEIFQFYQTQFAQNRNIEIAEGEQRKGQPDRTDALKFSE
jgi:hypothetical protein